MSFVVFQEGVLALLPRGVITWGREVQLYNVYLINEKYNLSRVLLQATPS